MKYIDKASITVNQEGKVISSEEAKERINYLHEAHMDWYLDPFCPYCIKMNTLAKDKLLDLAKRYQSLITYHFVTFLDENSSNQYSSLAAGLMLAVGEVKGEIFIPFMNEIMTKKFHPSPVQPREEDDFKALFLSLGGNEREWENVCSISKEAKSYAQKQTDDFFADEHLAKKSPLDGEVFVPFIVINNHEEAFNVRRPTTFFSFVQEQYEK